MATARETSVAKKGAQKPGFDVFAQTVIGHIEIVGDGGEMAAAEAAFRVIGKHSEGKGVYTFDIDGETCTVKVDWTQPKQDSDDKLFSLVVRTALELGVSTETAIDRLIADGYLQNEGSSVELKKRVYRWLNQRP